MADARDPPPMDDDEDIFGDSGPVNIILDHDLFDNTDFHIF